MKTLYVSRPLDNAEELKAWATSVGFENLIEDMHVTIAYSEDEVDWDNFKPKEDSYYNFGFFKRTISQFDGGVTVLEIEAPSLQKRFQEFIDGGCSTSYPDYKPHVSITAEPTTVDIKKIKPFALPLDFGPEHFSEVKTKVYDNQDSPESDK